MTARRRLLASGLTLALGVGLLVTSAGTAAAATITVNSLGDIKVNDGSCILREAIENANDTTPPAPWPDCATGSGNDTITFSVTGTILIGDALIVSDPAGLTIQGPGANLLTLDGGGFDGVISATGPLSLDGLTVANGNAGVGGGIYNEETLTITNSTISGNRAITGGGIHNAFEGTLIITNSEVSDNHADFGGGIYNEETLTITNSTISGNSVTTSGGGGGIHNAFEGTLIITNSEVSDNHADFGGGISNNNGTLTISDSTISGNSATTIGGGIANFNGFLSLTDSTLSGNTAANGGGIFNQGDSTSSPRGANRVIPGTADIVGSTFEDNQAYCDGGAINNVAYLDVTNSTFYANTADGRGGGLFNGSFIGMFGNEAEITNATFSGNSALGEASLPAGIVPEPLRCGPIQGGQQVVQQAAAGGAIFSAVDTITNPVGARLVTETSPVILKGTIIDHSREGGDCSGPIFDGGYNLDSDDSCQLSDENSSLPSTDPDLDPLEDNGGPTQTMALNTGSPALDLIPPGVCEHFLGHSPEDQRGIARPQGEGCDIGAFELEPGGTTPPPPPEQRWTEQTTIDLRGPFGAASASLGAERSSFKLKGTLYARHWFCQHNSQINLILVGQGQIGSTFTNGGGDFSFLTSLPQGEDQASYKARFPQKKGQPGRCKGSVSDPLVVTGG